MNSEQIWRLAGAIPFALGFGFLSVGLGNDVTFTKIGLALLCAGIMLLSLSFGVHRAIR